MAQRRMFSLKVIDTDNFLDMSPTAQNLYFHLGMRADDDGFVSNPKKIMQICGAPDDDMKVLVIKGFVIPMATNGVCVITHWKVNNLIRPDRYSETDYLEEKSRLRLVKNKWTGGVGMLNGIPNGNQMATQDRIGQDRIGQDKKNTNLDEQSSLDINKIFDVFYKINPTLNYGNLASRKAATWLAEKFGLDKVILVAEYAISLFGQEYAPTVTTPYQLKEKWAGIESTYKKQQSNKIQII